MRCLKEARRTIGILEGVLLGILEGILFFLKDLSKNGNVFVLFASDNSQLILAQRFAFERFERMNSLFYFHLSDQLLFGIAS